MYSFWHDYLIDLVHFTISIRPPRTPVMGIINCDAMPSPNDLAEDLNLMSSDCESDTHLTELLKRFIKNTKLNKEYFN